jgi:membrane dipeptidase
MSVKSVIVACLFLLPFVVAGAFAQPAPKPGGAHAAPSPAAASPDPLVQQALAIHRRVLTLDTHVDIGGATYATPALDPGGVTALKCDLTKMEQGGLKGVFLAVFVGQGPTDEAGYAKAWDQAMAKFEAIKRLLAMYPARAEFARTPADVERVAKTGKRVIMTGIENGYPMGTNLANLKTFYDLGARYITLAHSANNQLSDSSSAREPLHHGLSELGKQTVAEMNRLGLMVDVSHISEKAFWDVIATTKAPIIASHSGCKAVADSDRNLTDDQLKALAKNGGVVQMVALASYLKPDSPEKQAAVAKLREELGLPARGRGGAGGPGAGAGRGAAGAGMTDEQRAEYAKKMEQFQERMKDVDAKYPGASLSDFIDHLDHAVKIAGIDHVGIGTDFDGGGGIPGFNDDTEAPNVTIALVKRGYTEVQIRQIWGGNLLRVWTAVEKAAARPNAR